MIACYINTLTTYIKTKVAITCGDEPCIMLLYYELSAVQQSTYRVTMSTTTIMLTFLTDTRDTNSKDELKTYIFHEICFKINESAESATSCVE